MTERRLGLPNLGLGVGLRSVHYPYLLEQWPSVDWFEIISENYLDSRGRPRWVLQQVAERYPVVMHGVSLSIGSTDPLNYDYLEKLKRLAAEIRAVWISDHICWTGVNGFNGHDLLPIPLNEETLKHVVHRVIQVQEFLERPLVLENPSSYVTFRDSTMSEGEFMRYLSTEADCGLLLDVNNVYVSCFNHDQDPQRLMESLPHERIVQFHLAGHTHCGTHIIDTHDDHVVDRVWELYRKARQLTGGVATLLEWDASIPPFEVVHQEVLKAQHYFESDMEGVLKSPGTEVPSGSGKERPGLPQPPVFVTAEVE